VGTAFGRVDVVGKRENLINIGIVVLDRNLDLDFALFALDVDRLVQDRVAAIDVLAKGYNSAFVVEFLFLSERSSSKRIRTPLFRNASSRKPADQYFVGELANGENLRIRQESDLGTAFTVFPITVNSLVLPPWNSFVGRPRLRSIPRHIV